MKMNIHIDAIITYTLTEEETAAYRENPPTAETVAAVIREAEQKAVNEVKDALGIVDGEPNTTHMVRVKAWVEDPENDEAGGV